MAARRHQTTTTVSGGGPLPSFNNILRPSHSHCVGRLTIIIAGAATQTHIQHMDRVGDVETWPKSRQRNLLWGIVREPTTDRGWVVMLYAEQPILARQRPGSLVCDILFADCVGWMAARPLDTRSNGHLLGREIGGNGKVSAIEGLWIYVMPILGYCVNSGWGQCLMIGNSLKGINMNPFEIKYYFLFCNLTKKQT